MIYQEETDIQSFYDAGKDTFDQNNAELDFFNRELDLDIPLYQELLDNKQLRFYSIRGTEDQVIGYNIFTLYLHSHYKGKIMAEQDSLFILPGHRARAVSFLSWCDKQLKNVGVSAILRQVPKIKNWSLLLNRLNYEEIETVYMRKLKE